MDRKTNSLDVISSTQNQKVKNTILLQKPRERRKQNLFLVEGRKEIERAIQAGYTFDRIFVCRELYGEGMGPLTEDGVEDSLNSVPGLKPPNSESGIKHFPETCTIDYVSSKVYDHMAYRGTTEGIIAWVVPKSHELDEIRLSDSPLILVVDAVEKPGNLGAILRTADAAGIDALIISDTRTDVYNPNVIRSSLGAVFSTQVGVGESPAVIDWLMMNKIKIYCTALTASKPYTDINYTVPSAIVMGPEATGLSQAWLERSDQNIIIPMHGIVDSMNVSVSAGIVLFEAIRQRRVVQKKG